MRIKIIIALSLLVAASAALILVSIHDPPAQGGSSIIICGQELPIPTGLSISEHFSDCQIESVEVSFTIASRNEAEDILLFYQNYFKQNGWRLLDRFSGKWEIMVHLGKSNKEQETLMSAWSSPDEQHIGTVILLNESQKSIFPWNDDFRAICKFDPYIHNIQSYLNSLGKSGDIDKLMNVLSKYETKDGEYDFIKAAKENPENAYIQFYMELARSEGKQ